MNYYFFGILSLMLIVLLPYAIYESVQSNRQNRAYLLSCDLKGNRIEKGFGQITVYEYDCNGLHVESRRLVR